MNELVTMAHVAKRAGVHVTTVSLALRNHPSLPEHTKERIRALAAEMGYRPDPSLRALMAYRKRQRHARTVEVLHPAARHLERRRNLGAAQRAHVPGQHQLLVDPIPVHD